MTKLVLLLLPYVPDQLGTKSCSRDDVRVLARSWIATVDGQLGNFQISRYQVFATLILSAFEVREEFSDRLFLPTP